MNDCNITIEDLGGLPPTSEKDSSVIEFFTSSPAFVQRTVKETHKSFIKRETEYRVSLVAMLSEFLRQVEEHKGSIRYALKVTGMSRNFAFFMKVRCPRFGELWDEVVESVTDEIEEVAIKRTINGEVTAILDKEGNRVAETYKHSEKMLQFMLASRRSSIYKPQAVAEVNVSLGGSFAEAVKANDRKIS